MFCRVEYDGLIFVFLRVKELDGSKQTKFDFPTESLMNKITKQSSRSLQIKYLIITMEFHPLLEKY